jgi:autotransporter-associated beta strand protein
MSINAKSVKVLATAAFAIPMFVFAGHDWVGETLDATENLYLTGTAANWTPESVPESDYVRFMKGNTTATFNNMITPTDYFWVGSTSGTFTDTEGNPLWCVWQSLDDSADCGINADCKLAVCDAVDQRGNLWIKSGSYTFNSLDWGKGLGPAKIKLTGGTLKSKGFTNFSGKPDATLEIDGGTFDTDAEFVIGTTEGSTGIVHQTGGTFTPKKFWVGSRYEYGQKAFGRYVMTGGSITTDSGEDFVVGGQDYSTGVVEVVSGTINVGGNLLVPWGGNSTGRMTVGDGSVIECGNFRLSDNNGGDGEYTQNGGKMTVRSAATIANTASRAVATIKGGELLASGNINVATAAGGDGTLVLTGGTLSSGAWVCIGAGGNGYYVQKGGTFNITQAFISGQGSNNSAASYSIISNGTLNANQLFIAENSTSSDMTIEGGTVAISSTAYISKNSSEGRGVLTMNGGRLTIGAETYIANADNSTALVTLNGGDLETTAAKKFYVGKGVGSKGEIVVDGGHLKVNNEIHLAPSSGSTGIVHVTSGTITNTSWLVLGINDAYHESTLRIDGGEVYNQGNVTLGSSMGNGSKDNLVVAGTGILRTTGNIYIAEGHTHDASNPAEATVTVDGGLVDNSAGETQFFMGNSIAGTTGTLNLNGGEYITKQIQYVNGAGTAKVNFGGGKLKAASGSDSYIIWANGSAHMSASLVEDTTSTIDTSSQNLTINVPIDGAGNLVVTGGGSLALGAGMTYTGTTAVEAGTTLSLSDASATTSRLILRGGSVSAPANFSVAEVELASGGEVSLPSWYTTSMKLIISGNTTLVVPQGTELGDVEFRDNGKIVYTLSTYTAGETASVATIGTVTYPESETIAEHIYISVDGVRMATVADTNGALTAAPREVEWIGNGTVDYSDGTQWQGGSLTGFDIAVLGKDATVSSAHPAMKLTGGATVAVAQEVTIDALAIGAGGGSINTGSYGVTIVNVKSVEGTLGFSGTGTATISAAPAASVGLALSGTVVATVPYATKFSSLSFAARNLLFVDVSGLSEATTLETPCPISLPQGYSDPNWFIAPKGKRVVFDYNYDNGIKLTSMHPAAEGESVVAVFLGSGSGTGEWRTSGHWVLGTAPTSVDTAVLPFSGTVNMISGGNQTASNVVIKTSHVKFNSTNGWPSFGAEEIIGIEGATLELQTVGLKPASGKTMKVYVDCDCVATNPDQDTWFDGNDADSRLEMHGNICATNSPFRLNGHTDIYGKLIANRPLGDDNYISGGVTFQPGSELIIGENGEVKITGSNTFQGNVTVNGVLQNRSNGTTFSAGTVLSGSGTLDFSHSANFAANISGALTINLTGFGKNGEGQTYFSGDNSAFTGYLNSSSPYHNPYFAAASAGSASARFNFVGDVRTKFAEGVIKFGEAKFTKNDWCVCYIDDATGPVVFEIGALSTGEDTIGAGYSFGSNKDKLTIRKVGTGLLSTWGDQYQHLEVKSGTVAMKDNHGPSSTFIWTGGTLRFDAAYSWDPTPRFDCVNSTVVDIDTAGHDFTWGTALTDNVGITKRGDGVLTLTGAHTYTGDTTVLGGTLVLPLNTGVGTLAVADGATLAVDGSSLEVLENTAYEILSGSTDSASIARIRVTNSDWDWTTSSADGKISATAEAWGDVPNVWVGGEEGYWKDGVNWSRNIAPLATHTAKFTSSALVYLDGDKSIATLDAETGARVLFKSASGDRTLRPKTMTGSGTVALHHVGIIPSVAMTIPDTLTLEIVKVNDDNTIDSWLEGDTAETALTINAPIVGDGYIIFRDHVVLAGDNSGFTGKVLRDANGTLTFKATKSGSAAAAWEFQGDINTSAITEGTLSFGSLTLSGQKCWYQNSSSSMTIEIGALGQDMQFGGNFFFGAEYYDTGTNPENVTLKVVGGKLTYASYGMRKIEVVAGEMVLAAPTHGDGHWTSYRDNRAGYQIDSLVVRSGAALSGSNGDQKILSATFGNGSILKTTLKKTSETVGETTVTTYTASPVPAVEGTVDVSGIHVQVANPEFVNDDIMSGEDEAAKSALASTVFPLLKAGAVSGKATLDSELTGLGTKVWRTCNSATSLGLCCRNAKFVFLVR